MAMKLGAQNFCKSIRKRKKFLPVCHGYARKVTGAAVQYAGLLPPIDLAISCFAVNECYTRIKVDLKDGWIKNIDFKWIRKKPFS